jgi:hypothetical protein
MNRLAFLSNSGAFDSCVAYCLFAPYWIGDFGMVHAVVCLLCVEIVSKLSAYSLA